MTLNRNWLNSILDQEVFREPRNEQLIKDLCTVIGGDSNPQLTADDFSEAAFRIVQHCLLKYEGSQEGLGFHCAAGFLDEVLKEES